MYENHIHLLIYVDIHIYIYTFYTRCISDKEETNILKIVIYITVLGTLESLFIVMQGSQGPEVRATGP